MSCTVLKTSKPYTTAGGTFFFWVIDNCFFLSSTTAKRAPAALLHTGFAVGRVHVDCSIGIEALTADPCQRLLRALISGLGRNRGVGGASGGEGRAREGSGEEEVERKNLPQTRVDTCSMLLSATVCPSTCTVSHRPRVSVRPSYWLSPYS